MKTKEEIEQLIYGCFGKKEWDNISTNAKLSLIETYTQCQKDIIEELTMHVLINEHDWNRNPQAQLKDFINSLSKTKQ